MRAKNNRFVCAVRGVKGKARYTVRAPRNAVEYVAQLANRETGYYYSDYVRKVSKAFGLARADRAVRRAVRVLGLTVAQGRVYGKV